MCVLGRLVFHYSTMKAMAASLLRCGVNASPFFITWPKLKQKAIDWNRPRRNVHCFSCVVSSIYAENDVNSVHAAPGDVTQVTLWFEKWRRSTSIGRSNFSVFRFNFISTFNDFDLLSSTEHRRTRAHTKSNVSVNHSLTSFTVAYAKYLRSREHSRFNGLLFFRLLLLSAIR